MKGFLTSKCSKSPTGSSNTSLTSDSSASGPSNSTTTKGTLWSSFFTSAFSVFDTYRDSPTNSEKKGSHTHNGWTSAVKKIVSGGSMRRIQERILGPSRTGVCSTTSDIWLLGVCYKMSEDEGGDAATSNGLASFTHDFSSRILMTYRKGFEAIGDSKLTSDVGWGCMLRSSQMIVAQALLYHKLGRSWRKPFDKPLDQEYIEILHLFGDSVAAPFSIHNLIQAGKGYSLAAGSWVGPYAMCRTWESLVRSKREENSIESQSLPMAVYVVSGDEDGERGGAPVVCIEDACRFCLEFSRGQADWTPIVLFVPLVLGLDKVNPRYIPSLQATFTFPQSLGIMGGKPGASTYIVGVQDDNVFYLDPHEVQSTVNIGRDDLEADTSSYHSCIVRHIPLDAIDPSLAIGFYCRSRDDFDEFCRLASKLVDDSQGAPLFTVCQSRKLSKPVSHGDMLNNDDEVQDVDSHGVMPTNDDAEGDEWQLL
ncbi:cysteine protease ATG4-like [Mercurialis annua]|uniref:cysteine protease ATG4-like n=1 Tax=Mercurialis annua TaxID=3986 RepID=UPI00215EC078|nr:cysteine protease ATG4-like [Mercurialis annua]XP_050238725.1 cysteine protease ATG4-like [Mercurialis annua]